MWIARPQGTKGGGTYTKYNNYKKITSTKKNSQIESPENRISIVSDKPVEKFSPSSTYV